MKERGFEIVTSFKGAGITIPVRKTKASAGYDLETAEDITIPANGTAVAATGLKAYMLEDEYLAINIRSSLAFKQSICLVNSVGIVDADYYNNPDNEGHLMIGLRNFGTEDVTLKKGTRVAQGIFMKYLTVDEEAEIQATRTGGFGSTGA